jgi:PIN domain nuclease of toxin-antitoxin system
MPNSFSGLSVFLDTCALLYLASESDRLSTHALRFIDEAGVAYVSPISAWEIGLKQVRNQLRLPLPVAEWFNAAVSQHNLEIFPLSVSVCIAANELPFHHRDPADRFIVASARETRSTLITTDTTLLQYDVRIVS